MTSRRVALWVVCATLLASPAAASGDGAGARAPLAPSVGQNVNIIGASDAVQTRASATCDPGKQTAQNETSIAVDPEDPAILVAGANDYRLHSSTLNRYDASGGVYRSTDGGRTWAVGLLPGLVRSNDAAPGPYDAAGDPAIAAGPGGTFWYANIAFDRDRARSSVAVSRSTDRGITWTTTFVIQSSDGTFHDKEWIAAHPSDPLTAYVTWTRFSGSAAHIMLSRTNDGGATWTTPVMVAPGLHQASVPAVDARGRLHIVYAVGSSGIGHAISVDGGRHFVTRVLAPIVPWRSEPPGFRTHNFVAGFGIDGIDLHIVFGSALRGTNDVYHVRSLNGGVTWSTPVIISRVDGDQFFPWVAARNGRVFAGFYERVGTGTVLTYEAVASSDQGRTWSPQVRVSSAPTDAARANRFALPTCNLFMGDYTALAVGSDGVAHAMWADGRDGNSPGDPGTTADLDPYTATLTLP